MTQRGRRSGGRHRQALDVTDLLFDVFVGGDDGDLDSDGSDVANQHRLIHVGVQAEPRFANAAHTRAPIARMTFSSR